MTSGWWFGLMKLRMQRERRREVAAASARLLELLPSVPATVRVEAYTIDDLAAAAHVEGWR